MEAMNSWRTFQEYLAVPKAIGAGMMLHAGAGAVAGGVILPVDSAQQLLGSGLGGHGV